MVLDGFGFGIWFGLHYLFEYVGQFFCPLWGNNPLSSVGHQSLSSVGQQPLSSMGQQPLSSVGVTTLVLYGITTVVLYGTHHPLWLSFQVIGWFGLWLGFGFSQVNLWQDREAIIWVECFLDLFPLLMN
jgi:hypothetical protein